MCNPVMMAVGLAAMGTGLQARGQHQQDKARASAMKEERLRQASYEQQSQGILADQLKEFGDGSAQDRVDKRTADQNAQNEASMGEFDGESLGPSNLANNSLGSDKAIQNEIVRGLSEASDRSQREAAFSAYGRADNDFNRVLNKTGSDLGNIGDFSASSAAVLPLELAAANQKGRTAQMAGQLAGGVGGLFATQAANAAAPPPQNVFTPAARPAYTGPVPLARPLR